MKISANKGEWSEFYVLLRLLADKKIYSVDDNLTKDDKFYLPILKILRNEDKHHSIEYDCRNHNFVELYLNGAFVRRIETQLLDNAANFIFDSVANERGSSFNIPNADEIMRNLKCRKIKADSEDKTDITLEVHDPFTNFDRICGYSIKSDVGNPPTLFNSSQATNFKFEVLGINCTQIQAINSIQTRNKLKYRVQQIPRLNFVSTINETFHQNLMFVDTQMDKFLAEILKIYYRENISDCATLANILDERDPLNLKSENLYPHKLKKFLCAVALGLNPTKRWNGIDDANGGYIIVKETGEIVAYHLHNRNSFENYLLNNTRLDTPSMSRHKFGSIYEEQGRNFINLNLQIRFK